MATLAALPTELLHYMVCRHMSWFDLVSLRTTCRGMRARAPSNDEYMRCAIEKFLSAHATEGATAATIRAHVSNLYRLMDLGWVLTGGALQQMLLGHVFARRRSADIDLFRNSVVTARDGSLDVFSMAPDVPYESPTGPTEEVCKKMRVCKDAQDAQNVEIPTQDNEMPDYIGRPRNTELVYISYEDLHGTTLLLNLVACDALGSVRARCTSDGVEVVPLVDLRECTPEQTLQCTRPSLHDFDMTFLVCGYVPGCLRVHSVADGAAMRGTLRPMTCDDGPTQSRTMELPVDWWPDRELDRVHKYNERGYTTIFEKEAVRVIVGEDGEFSCVWGTP